MPLVVLLCLLLCSFESFATTYYVHPRGDAANTGLRPRDPVPLADAVSRSAAGDTIVLAGGTYMQTATVTIDKDLTIYGRGTATSLNCSRVAGTCIQINAPVSRAFTLSDLEITRVPSGYDAVGIATASPVIRRVRLFQSAGGIVATNSSALIENNQFLNGTNIFLSLTDSRATVVGNSFEHTRVGSTFGIREMGTSVGSRSMNLVTRNRFVRISTGVLVLQYGGSVDSVYEKNRFVRLNNGFQVTSASDLRIVNNLFHHGRTGWAISFAGTETGGVVAYNTLADNQGGGINISARNAKMLVVNNNLVGVGVDDASSVGISSSSADAAIGYNNTYNHFEDIRGTYNDFGGNISVDPKFVAGGYDLKSTSPVRGKASARLWFENDDILGRRRYRFPFLNLPDLGAYEYTR